MSRNIDLDTINCQFDFRRLWLLSLNEFNINRLHNFLSKEEEFINTLNAVLNCSLGPEEKEFYDSIEILTKCIFSLVGWSNCQINAQSGADLYLNALKVNADRLKLGINRGSLSKPSIEKMLQIVDDMQSIDNISKTHDIAKKLLLMPFPLFYTAVSDPFKDLRPNETFNSDEDKDKEKELPLLISVRFFIDNELWANPQIIKPNLLYKITGKVKLNCWPKGFDKLLLMPVTTTNNEWFILDLPEMTQNSNNEIDVEGSIVFKYPQQSFDEPISIRLVAKFLSVESNPNYPALIGYDQLIVKVLDESVFPFPTGYAKLNQKAMEIALTIEKEFKELDLKERNNFLTLLSGVLNYQGFCSQHGIYKNKSDILEVQFRDALIQYLTASPSIGGDIIKEQEVAGGRVEITYKGVICELKVESKVSDRTKLIDQYSKQPTAYATSVQKQLSILCILDTTVKKLPPALASNNVFLIEPKFHGFDDAQLQHKSKLAVVIIDANTPNPSNY